MKATFMGQVWDVESLQECWDAASLRFDQWGNPLLSASGSELLLYWVDSHEGRAVELTGIKGSIRGRDAFVIDRHGNPWVAYLGKGTVINPYGIWLATTAPEE